ncbi:MAG: hypothetical protein QOD26_2625 [Betaproteobacteria bacterium]|jgi:pimeloyl-ACP methyl ester carboxylesterase|nr:hypothetical protein [Betaproteobacteria bacterium]
MPETAVLGVPVHYREAGEGQGVVLLHSAGSTSGQWRKLMECLAGRHRALAPDLFGYGGTGHWPGGRADLIEDEAAIARAMTDIAGGPVHMVAHSYGAHVAMRAALEWPERVLSLTLIEPSMSYLLAHAGESAAYAEVRRVADAFFAFAAQDRLAEAARVFVDYWMGDGTFDAMPPERKATAAGNVRKLVYQWPFSLEREKPTLEDYAALDMPILLVQGAETTYASRCLMQVLRGVFRRHEFAQIAGAGHMSAITHADAVNKVVCAHLARTKSDTTRTQRSFPRASAAAGSRPGRRVG